VLCCVVLCSVFAILCNAFFCASSLLVFRPSAYISMLNVMLRYAVLRYCYVDMCNLGVPCCAVICSVALLWSRSEHVRFVCFVFWRIFLSTPSFYLQFQMRSSSWIEGDEETAGFALHFSILMNFCILLHDLIGNYDLWHCFFACLGLLHFYFDFGLLLSFISESHSGSLLLHLLIIFSLIRSIQIAICCC
jgi:hypothetical protein